MCPAANRRRQFRTIIFYKSLLPLQCPVSLPCRGVRLYLPPGGRWLGAQPQAGGSQRVQNQFNCRRWYLPKTVIFPMPIGGSCPVNSMSGVDAYEQVPPQSKPAAHRPQAPSDAFGASSLPEGAIFRWPLRFRIGLRQFEGACREPPGKNRDFCQLPQAGAAWVVKRFTVCT